VRTAPPPDTPEVIAAGREGRERARPKGCRPDEPQCYVTVGRAGLFHRFGQYDPQCAACNGRLYNYTANFVR
jgi:hypothetical protein